MSHPTRLWRHRLPPNFTAPAVSHMLYAKVKKLERLFLVLADAVGDFWGFCGEAFVLAAFCDDEPGAAAGFGFPLRAPWRDPCRDCLLA